MHSPFNFVYHKYIAHRTSILCVDLGFLIWSGSHLELAHKTHPDPDLEPLFLAFELCTAA